MDSKVIISFLLGAAALGITAFVVSFAWEKGKEKGMSSFDGDSSNASGCPVPMKPVFAPGTSKETIAKAMAAYNAKYQAAMAACATKGRG